MRSACRRPARPIIKSSFANTLGWDHNCEAVAHPSVHLDEPPAHGNVCAEIEDIKIRSMYYGTQSQCIGRQVRGVRLIYRPYPGYAGTDGIRYSVQYPSDRRSVSVTVTVIARTAGGYDAADVVRCRSSTAPDAQHVPGPVPGCAAFAVVTERRRIHVVAQGLRPVGQTPTPSERKIMIQAADGELIGVVIILLCAAIMARGGFV